MGIAPGRPPILEDDFKLAGGFGRRDLVPAKAARLLLRPSDPTTPTPRRLPVVPLVLVSPVRLAGSVRGRQDKYFHSLVSQRFQVVPALEVARWPPTAPRKRLGSYRSYVRENVTWGEERIADELSLKLGIYVSPRTVRKYWPRRLAADAREPRLNIGRPLSAIMHRASWPAIF